MDIDITQLLQNGREAKEYNRITEEILKEEAEKLCGISEQADNWSALAMQVVGANP